MARNRSRAYTFTIHNQGAYDFEKKQALLDHVKAMYPLTGYVIAQELYPNAEKTALDPEKAGDSHLQGNFYFKNQVDFHPLLKYLQGKFKEVKTDKGTEGRIQLLGIQKGTDTQMDNYFKGEHKVGADKDLLSDMKDKLADIADRKFNKELSDLLDNTHQMMLTRKWEKEKKTAMNSPHYDPHQWEQPPVWKMPDGYRWAI